MYLKLILATCLLAFCAIVLSAYARLSDAGLGCANWPVCYEENALKERQPPQAIAVRGHTSWQWKLHSQAVRALGILSVAVCGLAWLRRKELRQSPLLATLLLGLMVFFAAFGIWAFSHLQRTVIVQVHLAGGIAMMLLLTWIALRQITSAGEVVGSKAHNWYDFCRLSPLPTGNIPARGTAWLGLVLVAVQIMLGGWVSSNFAALACTDFPLCKGALLPPMDFSYSFSGLALSAERLTAIHWMHRIGALLTALYLSWLSFKLMAVKDLRIIGKVILGLVVFQLVLGISNVLFGLPLVGAVLHNATAMLLLAALTLLNFKLQKRKP